MSHPMRLRPGMRYSFRYFPPPEEVPGKGVFTPVFAPGAFDRQIGTITRLTLNGHQIGLAQVISAEVADDGGSVQLEYEVVQAEPDHEISAARLGRMSFAVPDPDDQPRDPLTPGQLRISWRDQPGQEDRS